MMLSTVSSSFGDGAAAASAATASTITAAAPRSFMTPLRVPSAAGLQVTAEQRVDETPRDRARGGGQAGQIDAGLDAHAVESVEKVLRGQVPAGPRGVRAAAEAAGRAVDGGDARLQRGEDVGQRRPPRVVEVHG